MLGRIFGGAFIDIIEWQQDSQSDVMCWKYPRHDNEIKNGAKLIVREGQRALFLSQGQLPDPTLPQLATVEGPAGPVSVFLGDSFGPGTYTLETKNLPILSKIQGWKYGFESPFKADVYFLATRRFTNQKWGTQNPLMLRDPEFGPVRVRAFGTYALEVGDPATFLRRLVATDPSFETYEISQQLRSLIVTRFSEAIASAGFPVLDMASNLTKVGEFVREKITPDLAEFGLKVPLFLVENISLPPQLEEMLDKRASIGIVGDLNQYTRLQAANALGSMGNNPAAGAAALGMGMGAGVAFGQQMAAAFQPGAPPAALPPPLPAPVAFFAALGGQQAGPFDTAALQQHIAAGRLTRETLVWRQGMAGWTAAGQVPDLAPLFAAVPPPLPPA